MSEALEQGADAPATDTDAPVVDAETTQDAPQSPSPDAQIEAAARSSGWSDKDSWKGDPNDWLPAPQFILKAVGEVLPDMRKSLKDARSELKTMGATLAKTVATAYDRAMVDLKAQQAAAVQAGDVEAVDEITDQIADMKAGRGAQRDDGGFQETFAAWKAENAWYDADPAMQEAAFGIAEKLRQEGKSPSEQLPLVAKRIKELFPAKFENPRRREAAAAEGATTARRTGGKTFSDLPADARQMCIEFERDLGKSFSRDRYVKEYFS